MKAVKDTKEDIEFFAKWVQLGEKLNLKFNKDEMENATTQLSFVRSVNEKVQISLSDWTSKFTVLDTIAQLTK